MGTKRTVPQKAGTFILGASIIVWFLTAYPMDVQYSQDFDAAKDQVTAQMEQQQAGILQTYGLTSIEENSELNGMYESMIAAADAAAEEEDSEEEDVESVQQAEAVEEKPQYPDAFADLEASTRRYMLRHCPYSTPKSLLTMLRLNSTASRMLKRFPSPMQLA